MIKLTKDETRALEYLKNVGSDIRVSQFDDDFKPIGPSLRNQLNQKGSIEEFDGWIGIAVNLQPCESGDFALDKPKSLYTKNMQKLYDKYIIKKTVGATDPEARYFVLRLDTDPAARVAMATYADEMEKCGSPTFANQIRELISGFEII